MSSLNLIKQEALKLFSIHGYEGTSMEAIATEVGIRKASLYSHFKGKKQIFLTIVDELIRKNQELLKRLTYEIAESDPKEQLYAIFQHLACYPLEADQEIEFNFFRRMSSFPPYALKSVLLEKLTLYERQLKELLASIFTKGMDDGTIRNHDIYDLLNAFICISDGVMMQFQYGTNEQFLRIVESAWHVFCSGIFRKGEAIDESYSC